MTKDEFIKKFHTQKVLRFEPPTWEEFLATRDINKDVIANWRCGNIAIIMEEENNDKCVNRATNKFIVDCRYSYKIVKYEYNNFVDNREEMYYKALDIAKKWFLGEEV